MNKIIFEIRIPPKPENKEYEPEKDEHEPYFVAYDFEERNLTYMGRVFSDLGDRYIEYKDAVYFVNFDKTQNDVRMKVLKYKTSRQEVTFDKIIDHSIQEFSSSFISEYMLFIKEDILCIYFFNQGLIFSLDLQDQEAELQQHRSPRLEAEFGYTYCFNMPFIYFFDRDSIHEIDCTDIANIKIKSEKIKVYENNFNFQGRNEAVFLNGKIYSFSYYYFYQFDIETKTMKKISLVDLIPFDYHEVKGYYITSENEIRLFGLSEESNEEFFFMEITFDDENNTI